MKPFDCTKVIRETDGFIMSRRSEELLPAGNIDNYIKLDRFWVLDTSLNLQIRKVTKKPMYARIPHEVLSSLFLNSFVFFELTNCNYLHHRSCLNIPEVRNLFKYR